MKILLLTDSELIYKWNSQVFNDNIFRVFSILVILIQALNQNRNTYYLSHFLKNNYFKKY